MGAARPADRERFVGVVLTRVVALSRWTMAERRTPFEGLDLTSNQLALLFLLAHSRDPITPGGAATSLGVTAGAITQLVDGLRAAGLVKSMPNPADRRSRVLHLTEPARQGLNDFEARVVQRMLPQFATLSDTDLGTLADLLDAVGDDRLPTSDS